MNIPIFHWSLEFSLNFLGLLPNKPNLFNQLLLCSSLVVISPFQLKDILFYDNRAKMLDGVRDMAVIIFLVVKFLIMLSNKSSLHFLLKELEEDWKNIKNSKNEKIMMEYVNYAHKFCISDWSLYAITTCTYIGEFFIIYFTNTSDQKILFIPATYPFDINPLPIFIAVTILQSVLFGCWVCANALSETLLATLVFHLVGRIEILRNEIGNMSFSPNTVNSKRYLIDFIKKIVYQHRKLIIISQKIEAIYSYICLIQFFTSTITLCLAGYLFITSVDDLDLFLILKYICFILLMLLQSFAICFCGEILLTKSLSIPQSIINCSWYETSPENIKLLLMIIVRTQKPMSLTIGKFTALSIKGFTKILQTSVSYLSVLRTAY
ncbi:odorant receptor 13a-like [Leptopilina boulardi]|uniref:odorant receptor 13a-like n=1 Tax=Leptopilina boulardi TaxID=63433 RepID=UPI0021F653EB|nr:odorant receptor 13a-like [Leptopilina boulardi]